MKQIRLFLLLALASASSVSFAEDQVKQKYASYEQVSKFFATEFSELKTLCDKLEHLYVKRNAFAKKYKKLLVIVVLGDKTNKFASKKAKQYCARAFDKLLKLRKKIRALAKEGQALQHEIFDMYEDKNVAQEIQKFELTFAENNEPFYKYRDFLCPWYDNWDDFLVDIAF